MEVVNSKMVLHVHKCSDGMMWYYSKVGKQVPFVREESDCYLSREDSGLINIVKKEDATIVTDQQ